MKKVVKFGGSSLANAEQFRKVADIIHADPARCYVVVSAPGKDAVNTEKVTDLLYQFNEEATSGKDYTTTWNKIKKRYKEIVKDLGLKIDLTEYFNKIEEDVKAGAGKAYAASRGEYLNGLVAAEFLGFKFVDPADIIRFHDDDSTNYEKSYKLIAKGLQGVDKAVIPGFYGSKDDGTVMTFSRGGSDVTGSLIAKGASVDMYENWTDVSGFLMTDPRIVKGALPIETITYSELRELSYMGASVLHEDAFFPVRKDGIPINIKNTNIPSDPGTLIVESTCRDPEFTITGIAGKKGFCAVNIDKPMMNSEVGFCMKVLNVFAENNISIEHMPSGVDTMSVVVNQKVFEAHEQQIISGIHREVKPEVVSVEPGLALIAVVGRGMKANRGTAGRIFSALALAGVNIKMIDQGSSELNIIVGVEEKDFETAIKSIYEIYVTK